MSDPADAYELAREAMFAPLDYPPGLRRVSPPCDHSQDPCPGCGHHTEPDQEDE